MYEPINTTPMAGQVDGLARLAARGLELSERHLRAIQNANGADDDGHTPIIRMYPKEIIEGEVYAVGRCPLCKRIHGHGVSFDPYRVPHCAKNAPPFHDGRKRPDLVRMVVVVDELPEDVRFELGLPDGCRDDLLNYAQLALSAERWTGQRMHIAITAILRSGVLGERIALRADGARITAKQARRDALAAAIRGRGPGKMRLRLARTLWWAYFAVGRGEA